MPIQYIIQHATIWSEVEKCANSTSMLVTELDEAGDGIGEIVLHHGTACQYALKYLEGLGGSGK